ncbi:MAG: hypothetical protein ACF8R7_15345 [Phycisphaerales bacterium JB039]
MRFCLVDAVIERSEQRIVTLKHVSSAEEYLQDHFPGYPVLPGVLMVEALAQAGCALLSDRVGPETSLVLGSARAVKFGHFLRPGWTLRAEVSLRSVGDDGFTLDGRGLALAPGAGPDGAPTAVSGRLTLRPCRLPRG